MIKKTLCFSNPAYLSLRDAQLVIKLPEVEKAEDLTDDFRKSAEITRPIEEHTEMGWIHHVSVLYLCSSLCKYGECRGS